MGSPIDQWPQTVSNIKPNTSEGGVPTERLPLGMLGTNTPLQLRLQDNSLRSVEVRGEDEEVGNVSICASPEAHRVSHVSRWAVVYDEVLLILVL